LSANAKVQWAWTNLATSGLSATVNSSYVLFSVAEEWKTGEATGNNAGDDPVYIAIGGGTESNTVSWGLLSW